MIIDKITVTDIKDVTTMKMQLNSNLIEEFSSDDGGSSFCFANFKIVI